jgi:hypothetical protein
VKNKTVGSSLSLIRTGQFREGSEEGGQTEEREGETKKLENGVLIYLIEQSEMFQ